jgi:hypothetical protein
LESYSQGYKLDGTPTPGYLGQQNGADYNEVWVVDYKKDGACPLPNSKNANTKNFPNLANNLRSNNNNKVTCEKFATDWLLNGDPCASMANDVLYQVRYYAVLNALPSGFTGGEPAQGHQRRDVHCLRLPEPWPDRELPLGNRLWWHID